MGEELWALLGHDKTLAYESWPEADERLLVEEQFEYPVSFNGKLRFKLELPLDLPVAEIERSVMENERTQRYLEGKALRKIIVVPGKIINVVLG